MIEDDEDAQNSPNFVTRNRRGMTRHFAREGASELGPFCGCEPPKIHKLCHLGHGSIHLDQLLANLSSRADLSRSYVLPHAVRLIEVRFPGLKEQ